jgi:chromosome segregation ATPase
MNLWKKYNLLPALLILISFTISCGEMNKANKLVEEGNAAAKEGDKFAEEAKRKIDELHGNLNDFPSNREPLKSTAQEILASLDQSIARLREAAAKFSEAGTAKIDAPLKEYLSLKSQEFSKHAEHMETWKEFPNAIMDTSIEDRPALDAKFAQLKERLEQMQKDWTDLGARAEKIKEDNKNKFQNEN